MLFPRIGIYVLSGKITIVTLPQTGLSKTVIRMLGRCSAGFTLDTCAHVTTDAQLKAAQAMGKPWVICSPALSAPVGVSVWVRKNGRRK